MTQSQSMRASIASRGKIVYICDRELQTCQETKLHSEPTHCLIGRLDQQGQIYRSVIKIKTVRPNGAVTNL